MNMLLSFWLFMYGDPNLKPALIKKVQKLSKKISFLTESKERH